MTGSEKVFFDTAPFIYLLENHFKYYFPVAEYITRWKTAKESIFVTSVLSFAEFGVKPKKVGNESLIQDFIDLSQELNFQVVDINLQIANLSSTFIAKYSFLKGMDALQIATAVDLNCEEFLTNDKNLKPIKEIKIILIEDLMNL